MVSDFLVEARLGPFSLPRVITTRPTMRKIRRGNAVWEGWRLATEPTIEPDAYQPTPCAPGSPPNYSIGPPQRPSRRGASRCRTSSAKRSRVRGHGASLTSTYWQSDSLHRTKNWAFPPNVVRRRSAIVTVSETTSQRNDFDGGRFTGVLPSPTSPRRARDGNESKVSETREDDGCALMPASLFQRRGDQYTGSPTSPRRTFVVGHRANLASPDPSNDCGSPRRRRRDARGWLP